MEKRNKIVLLIAIFGIILLILTGVIIKINKYNLNKEITNLKSNLLSITKKCIEESNCKTDTLTIKDLDNLGYIDNNTKNKLKDYSNKSYIIYSIKEVYLIKWTFSIYSNHTPNNTAKYKSKIIN